MDINELLENFLRVDVSASVREVLTQLRNSDRQFIMVTKTEGGQNNLPMSLVKESRLVNLATNQEQTLYQLLSDLPPVLVLDEDDLNDENLADVLSILGGSHAPGTVVRLRNHELGMVSRASLARAIPLEAIAVGGAERSVGGGIYVPPKTYVCRKCNPWRFKRPSSGGPPNCDIWSHGSMESA